ncbi:MAG: hypothetical protein JXA78_20005 [Anaerolineales bacterium]|nr:hypothetical protein [Anaerolineales bacterium]
MDELTERDCAAYAAVDDALRSYTVQPAPVELMPAVMACIQAAERAPSTSRRARHGRASTRWPGLPLRLTWLDYAISLFAASMLSLVLFLAMSISLPPDWSARLQFQLLVWWGQFRLGIPAFEIVLLSSAALGLLGLLLGAILFGRQRLDWL